MNRMPSTSLAGHPNDVVPRDIILEPKLVVRGTTAPPP
jgi:hypothetical protein